MSSQPTITTLGAALGVLLATVGAAQVIPPPVPNPLAPMPLPLSAHRVPKPTTLATYVRDEAAAVRLGKALFFDMQAGSDGVVACATCHFQAGADGRIKNQLNPGTPHGATTFEAAAGPNATVARNHLPFHRFADPNDGGSPILFDTDDVMSSAGVFKTRFVDVVPGRAEDQCIQDPDPIWNVAGTKVRRVEPRNTPSVINAIFNFRNFWDGRASFLFNGVSPVGPRDPNARVLQVQGDGSVVPVQVLIDNASLASQAVGPAGSPFEMSCDGRTFPKIGKKLLSLPPLAKQSVDPGDSVLGTLAKGGGGKGLTTTYAQLIQAAFQDRWWNSPKVVTFPGGVPTVSDPTGAPLTTDQYTVMEANFSLFWGLAIQLYEATLVSGQTPYDAFAAGDGNALSLQQRQGLDLFLNEGSCIICHGGSLFSNATIPQIGVAGIRRPEPEFPIERMHMQLGISLSMLNFVRPAAGVPPILPLDFEPRGATIAVMAGSCTDPAVFAGTLPGTPGDCTPTLPAPLTVLPSTGAFALASNALATADFTMGAACGADFVVSLLNVPEGDYTLCVDGVDRGPIVVRSTGGGSEGFTQFKTPPPPPLPPDVPLTVDPRGSTLQITQGPTCSDPVAFQRVFPGTAAPDCDPLVPIDLARVFSTSVEVSPTGAIDLGPFPLATATLDILKDCSATFTITLLGVPGGTYAVCSNGTLLGSLGVIAEARYDEGFYNIGVRPTGDDLGVGGEAMGPIAFSRRLQLGLPIPELDGIFVPPAILPGDRIAVDGAMKAPILRNVELTAPYMQNGGMGTLQQVVQFYSRGADFFIQNIDNLDPEVAGIGPVRRDPALQAALVSFLQSLTDDRVRFERAPFDHPELIVPNGHPGTSSGVIDDGTGKARDVLMDIPAVGAAGRCTGIDGTPGPPPQPCPPVQATVEADVSVHADGPTLNFGPSAQLEVDATPARQAFLRVRVSGVAGRQVTGADLRLQATTASAASSDSGGRLHRITSCDWLESGLTWDTRPAIDGAVLATAGKVAAKGVVDFNVTGAIPGDGVYCFALETSSANDVIYRSRESGSGGPQLLLTVTGTCGCSGSSAPACGDGVVDRLEEECDGHADAACPGKCRSDCTCPAPVCGDGVRNRGVEQCDGGDASACPGRCRSNCTCPPPVCGDGIVQAGEQCDGAARGVCAAGCNTDCTCAPGGAIEADAYVDSGNATKNFGTATVLQATTSKQIFLRFRVAGTGGRAVTSARVRMQCGSNSGSGSSSGGSIAVTSCGWTETGLTWATKPAVGPSLATLGAVDTNQVVDFDVTGQVPGDGVYCFAITGVTSGLLEYRSREAGSGAPLLVLALGDTAPPPTITMSSTSTTSSSTTSTTGLTPTTTSTSSSSSSSTVTSTSVTSSTSLPGGGPTVSFFQAGVSGPAGSAAVDTYVRLSTATTSFGTATDLYVGVTNAATKVNRTLMAFDLAGIPADATVTGCALRMNVIDRNSPTAGHVRRLCGEHWLDGDGQGESQATWSAWKTGGSWSVAGAGAAGDCTAGADYTTDGEVAYSPPAATGPFIFPDLSALCQDAVTRRNGKLRLRITQDSETTQSNLLHFDSSEATTAANRPRLTVTWSAP